MSYKNEHGDIIKLKTRSDFDLAIKRANTRISAIANEFGTDSRAYQNAIKPFLTEQFDGYTHATKKGVLQLNRSQLARSYGRYDDLMDEGKKMLPLSPYMFSVTVEVVPTLTSTFSKASYELGMDYNEFRKLPKEQQKKHVEEILNISENFEMSKEQFYEVFTVSEREKLLPDMYESGESGFNYQQQKKYAERMKELSEKYKNKARSKNNFSRDNNPLK